MVPRPEYEDTQKTYAIGLVTDSQGISVKLYGFGRKSDKPYLLIDFSDYLQINVYILGAVFLQLCQVLLLVDHPVFEKLLDPSLFIQRFTDCLLQERDNAVTDTALRIVASMKRDWMQTGRKPSGICGAALYIAALSHGHEFTKADIVSVVHICEATLTKRLIEFENTDSGKLTIEELKKADELNQESVSKRTPKTGEILCKHKDKDAKHFAHGLCELCYNSFTEMSGGLEGGADPPAFQRAEKQRLDAAKRAEEAATNKEAALEDSFFDPHDFDTEKNIKTLRKDTSGDKLGENGKGDPDPESLSDIDDVEVDGYLHNEEETKYKKVIWEEMNKEYLEEQAAKEALAAELAARGLGVEEKKKRRRYNDGGKSLTPAETPEEATCNMLKRKRLGSKINEEAVARLYNSKDEDGNSNAHAEMYFSGEYGDDKNDGETFGHGYDYEGYGDGGDGANNDDYGEFDF